MFRRLGGGTGPRPMCGQSCSRSSRRHPFSWDPQTGCKRARLWLIIFSSSRPEVSKDLGSPGATGALLSWGGCPQARERSVSSLETAEGGSGGAATGVPSKHCSHLTNEGQKGMQLGGEPSFCVAPAEQEVTFPTSLYPPTRPP